MSTINCKKNMSKGPFIITSIYIYLFPLSAYLYVSAAQVAWLDKFNQILGCFLWLKENLLSTHSIVKSEISYFYVFQLERDTRFWSIFYYLGYLEPCPKSYNHLIHSLKKMVYQSARTAKCNSLKEISC